MGETRDAAHVDVLQDMLHRETDPGILSCVIRGLHRLSVPALNASLAFHLSHPEVEVRLAALEAFDIEDDEGLRKILSLMGDPDAEVCQKAQEKIKQATYQNPLILIKSLNIPGRKLREHLFDLLNTLNIKAPAVYRFARTQLKKAYLCLLEAEALRAFSEGPERNLLTEHLAQEVKGRIETILRVLSIQDTSGQIRIIWRSLFSADSRQRANGIEALADTIDRTLSKILVPLVEDIPLSEKMKAGRKEFAFPDVRDKTALILHLLEKPDWVTVFFALTLLEKEGPSGMGYPPLGALESSENPWIREKAAKLLHGHQLEGDMGITGMDAPPDLTTRMLHLKTIGIFQGLTVAELAAVSTGPQFISCGSNEVVMREGDPGNALYLIMEGGVSVIKGKPGRKRLEIATLTPGDYFGEMALLDEAPRSATILTTGPSRFMVLYKADFDRLVTESPQIALNICKTLSRRIRSLHERISGMPKPTHHAVQTVGSTAHG
ncbi:MAG: cyclic nucleotide-binding domain-containing protein [Deltaproteobacteria bacterium]